MPLGHPMLPVASTLGTNEGMGVTSAFFLLRRSWIDYIRPQSLGTLSKREGFTEDLGDREDREGKNDVSR
jgi:hypothetical protein